MTNTSLINNSDWFNALIEDCDAIIVEKVYESNMVLIEGYHLLGTRILADLDKFASLESAINDISVAIGRSRRTLMYAIKLARRFPNLNEINEGKNITWSKVIKNYLTEKNQEQIDETINNDIIKQAIINNIDFLVSNYKLSKNMLVFFLPKERLD